MPTESFAVRYFIHFEQGEHGDTDKTGQIFDSDQDALTKAQIIADELADVRHGQLRVVNAAGREVGVIPILGRD